METKDVVTYALGCSGYSCLHRDRNKMSWGRMEDGGGRLLREYDKPTHLLQNVDRIQKADKD